MYFEVVNTNKCIDHFWPTFTWSSVHGLDLFSRLEVPQTDVCVQGAGGSDGAIVTDVH